MPKLMHQLKFCKTFSCSVFALSLTLSGKVKAIGVSNFEKNHLEDIISMGEMLPALNQVKLTVMF